VSLSDGESYGHLYSFSTFLLEDDLKVSWLGNVEEVLGIAAPELVFFAIFHDSLAACCLLRPFACKLLLNGLWKLYNVNVL
jgi:hypothetical protein